MGKEITTVSATGGQKGVKAQAYDKLPPLGLHGLAVLYGIGSAKYDAERPRGWKRNWQRGYEYSKSFAAAQRHASLFWGGEDLDLELGSVHTSNVAWHCAVMYTFCFSHPGYDDRINSSYDGGEFARKAITLDKVFPTGHTDLDGSWRGEEIEPRFDLIPIAVLAELATLYGTVINGERLIEPVTTGVLWSDHYSQMMEHLWKFWGGENYDKHDKHHLIYALHHALSLTELYHRYPEYDDRFLPSDGAQPIGFDSAPTVKAVKES